MPQIGPLEVVIVLVIALLVFGPKKLPELGRGLGRGMRDFKRGLSGDDFDDKDDDDDDRDRRRDADTAAIPAAAPVQAAPPPPPAPEPAVAPAPEPEPVPTAHEGEIVDEPSDVHAPR
jgi:sec-independent protein translocase protein TatA